MSPNRSAEPPNWVPRPTDVKPVQIWAAVGGASCVLQLYVWVRWITGPYFERVPGGPSDPPMYMKAR